MFVHTKEIGQNLFLIDLETGGFKNLIASYVLKGEKTLIVESGPTSSVGNLLSGLKELDVKTENVAFVAISHVHLDHGGGAGTLLRSLPNAKVIVHSKGAAHIKDPSKLWSSSKEVLGYVAEMFGVPEPVPGERIVVASEGTTYDLGKNLKVIAAETPGHASHNLSFYEALNRGIFPGDAAGAFLGEFDAVFPITPPPFRPDTALISIDKLLSFNPEVLYYSHFGKALNADKRLRQYALQIKMWLSIVEAGLKNNESEEVIRETVLMEDETIQKVVPFLNSDPVNRKTLIENSVRGFIEFARNPVI
jgi:glyoxylase-like metal-dependent hydrolase (beta-lactamase superfamily II)